MHKFTSNITAAILCGGKSSRMGREKAFAFINGLPIFEHVLNELKKIFSKIIISTNNPDLFAKYNFPVIVDIIPEKDSLGGIYSVLKSIDTNYAFIIACDMPFAQKEAIEVLTNNIYGNDIVIPKINGRFQPFFAIYSKNCTKQFEEALKKDELKIASIFPKVKTKIISENDFKNRSVNIKKNFFNVNTEDDLEKALSGKFEDISLIGIVAKHSNSGKTTLISNLIELFKKDGFKVGVIKNTFHNLEFDKKGKDSYKFFETGADTVVINSDKEIIVRKRLERQFPIKYIKDSFLRDMDIILLEGHKSGNFPKIEMIKDGQNDFLFNYDSNIIAIVSNKDINSNIPCFNPNECEKIYNFIKKKCLE